MDSRKGWLAASLEHGQLSAFQGEVTNVLRKWHDPCQVYSFRGIQSRTSKGGGFKNSSTS